MSEFPPFAEHQFKWRDSVCHLQIRADLVLSKSDAEFPSILPDTPKQSPFLPLPFNPLRPLSGIGREASCQNVCSPRPCIWHTTACLCPPCTFLRGYRPSFGAGHRGPPCQGSFSKNWRTVGVFRGPWGYLLSQQKPLLSCLAAFPWILSGTERTLLLPWESIPF